MKVKILYFLFSAVTMWCCLPDTGLPQPLIRINAIIRQMFEFNWRLQSLCSLPNVNQSVYLLQNACLVDFRVRVLQGKGFKLYAACLIVPFLCWIWVVGRKAKKVDLKLSYIQRGVSSGGYNFTADSTGVYSLSAGGYRLQGLTRENVRS